MNEISRVITFIAFYMQNALHYAIYVVYHVGIEKNRHLSKKI